MTNQPKHNPSAQASVPAQNMADYINPSQMSNLNINLELFQQMMMQDGNQHNNSNITQKLSVIEHPIICSLSHGTINM